MQLALQEKFRRVDNSLPQFIDRILLRLRHRRRLQRSEAAERQRSEAAERQQIQSEFDREFYLTTYPDVAQAGMDPLTHFIRYGWREGRDPNRSFSSAFYLQAHPDVRRSGMNPFHHHLLHGRAEGRVVQHPLGQKAALLAALKPSSDRLQYWKRRDRTDALLKTSDICSLLNSKFSDPLQGLIVAITHDDYAHISGGLQTVVRTEEAAALQAGYDYLGVWPWQALPCLSVEADPVIFLRLNGQPLGTAMSSTLVAAVAECKVDPRRSHLIVHSLLGHEPDKVRALSQALGLSKGWYWLHDYFGMCPGYTLQRNDLAFCGAPPPRSAGCGICIHGQDRPAHLERLRDLFDTVAMTVVSPSKAALGVWARGASLAVHATLVHPLADLVFEPRLDGSAKTAAVPTGAEAPKPVRFAFLGATVAHKGWGEYLRLAAQLGGTAQREFHYFGHYDTVPEHILKTRVEATGDDPDAMQRAVGKAGIDVYVHWSSWPETFSFTTLEALAAGAVVLTSQVSGNVATLVRTTGRGRVFGTFEQLVAFVEGPGLDRLVRDARVARAAECARITRSRMTLDLIAPEQLGQ